MEDITNRFKGYNDEQISIALQSEFSLSKSTTSSTLVDDNESVSVSLSSVSVSNRSCPESPITIISDYHNDYFKDDNAYSLYEKVKRGNPEAMFKLAVCFWRGKHVKKSQKHAIIWFRKAALAGNSDAQFNLALCYYDGKKGIEKNEKRALYWFSKSAKNNNVNAQYLLGVIYDVEKNEDLAMKWYQKAAEQVSLM